MNLFGSPQWQELISGLATKAATLAQFAATTSAQLRGVISDETGTGALVFADTPTLVTPVIGAATGTSVTLTGTGAFYSGTAIPAGGATGSGVTFSSTANYGTFFGSGAPTLSAAKGSLYLRSDGSTTNDRAYINTDGGTTWTALITAA